MAPSVAPQLCLMGPPGVGKTSLVRAMAEGLGHPMASIALGGFADAELLRGWDRAYVGARPGEIVRALTRRQKVRNGVIRLDEIDEAGHSEPGNPIDVLLELLDPDQGREFRDLFVDVPFDVTETMYVPTANDVSGIHPALVDDLCTTTARSRASGTWNGCCQRLFRKAVVDLETGAEHVNLDVATTRKWLGPPKAAPVFSALLPARR